MAEEHFDFEKLFQLTTAAQAVLDDGFRVVSVNDAYCARVGVPREDLLGANVLKLYPEDPAPQALVIDAFKSALAGQAASLKELHYAIPDPADPTGPKQEMWWTIDCIPMGAHATHGKVFLVKLENVTQEVLARNKRDIFAAELQHRIGNVLTLVQIIARKTAQSSKDIDSFLAAYERRIRALGKTHAFLSGNNWDGMTVREIIEQQIQSENIDRPDAIGIKGPEWRMSVLHAQTFAMAVHELVSNASDHGALSIPDGKVLISWDQPQDGSHNFVWKESGLRDLKEPENQGFGMQMLTRLLPGQLGGKAVCAFAPTGFHYMLVVPQDVPVPVRQRRKDAGKDSNKSGNNGALH